MEQNYEGINIAKEDTKLLETASQHMLETASESLLANLPILILGLVIFLAMAREFIV